MSRLNFTERRRRAQAFKSAHLDKLEMRNTMTEPISVAALSVSALRALAQMGIVAADGGNGEALSLAQAAYRARVARSGSDRPAPAPPASTSPDPPPSLEDKPAAGGGGGQALPAADLTRATAKSAADRVAPLEPSRADSAQSHGIGAPWRPATSPGGGAALPPRGGSGAPSPTKVASHASAPAARLPQSTPAAANSAALLAAVASASASAGGNGAPTADAGAPPAPPHVTGAGNTASTSTSGGSSASSSSAGVAADTAPSGSSSSGGAANAGSTAAPTLSNTSGPSENSFPYFAVYVLDVNHGVVLFPGVDQVAVPDSSVVLQAQVSGATVSSYDWNTSGISSDATSISGGSTYQLTFDWSSSISSNHVDSLTLSVTDSSSQIETYTYDFALVRGGSGGSGGGGNATWPTSYAPNTVSAADSEWASDGVSVDSNSGALDTSIPLPSYDPNVEANDLTYDSITANPMPIIIGENTLSSSSAVPSQVSATLTFNGTVGTTYYYNTSTLNPGDVQQIALQATSAAALSTGRYSYSMQIVDYYSTHTTITLSGTATVINESSSAFGDGWTLDGLEQIITASGGVILNEGGGGDSLWFAGSPGSGGGTYTTPAGDFSTLVKNSGGTYTRTLPTGDQITFNSGGYETATIDLNNNHVTYSYNGSNELTSIEDQFGNFTTLTYSSGNLSTILDPPGRLTTFTMSSGELTAVEQADSSHITYTYDGSGRMTELDDPMGNTVTISYDSAERVGTITRPDLSTEEFSAYQEQGFTNTGTSGSPAPATLFAASAASYTDPNANVTTLRPDWYGLGMTGVAIDALGDVATYDLNSNGLATATIDPLNRMSTYTYDSLGNVTGLTNPDGTTESSTYNSDSEPLTATNEAGGVTSYTYDAHGDNTVIEDPMQNFTTMTYTSGGQVQTVTNANDYTTTYLYDSQARLTTIVYADNTTEEFAYNSQGNVIKVTDERGNSTTYSFDAMNRETGMTDALDDITTYVYNADGDLTEDEEPTPAGQTARTTIYTYNSMDEMTVSTDPLGLATTYGYDADGNQVTVRDPMNRVTTTVFDALNRPIVVIDPMGNATTTTYDADDEVVQTVDPMGRITTATYSVRGWVPTVTDPLDLTTTYSYNSTGQTTSVAQGTSGGGGPEYSGYTYNADEELISEEDALGRLTSYSYDGLGNLISTTDPNGNTTTYQYDSTNELTTVTNALGDSTVYGYDASGNQITVTDSLGHTTTTLYDALDRPTTIISATGGITTITYDAAGRETSLTDPDGNVTRWAYDSDDRLTTYTEPNGHTVTYVYDNDGEVTDMTDADGRRTTYSYNADGDEIGETWVGASPAEKITYTYDADNEMTGASDSFATLTFTYTGDGQVQTAGTTGPGSGQPSVLLSYTYDPAGSETSITDNLASAGVTTYSYNADEQVTSVASSYGGTAGPQVAFTYDSGGRLTSADRTIGGSGDSVNTTYGYDAANRQTTITDTLHVPVGSGGGTTTPIATYVYDYDSANRVTTMVDAEGTYTYTYDNANELTNVDENGTQVESYSYDLNGNRDSTGYSTTVMNETATSPGVTYTYDNAGNMISAKSGSSTTTYTYDYDNRLTAVDQNGTVIASYVYDALGRRIGVDDNGTQTWTVYDGTNPYADFSGSGTLQVRYQFGPGVVDGAIVDQLLARTSSGGTTAWYLPDKLGSVRDIVSSTGTELDHIVYDSFGNIVTETDAANGDRFKFAGMEYDPTTGQYYDRARIYDSSLGHFSSLDPLGFAAGYVNLYTYVGSSPTDDTDPLGESGGSSEGSEEAVSEAEAEAQGAELGDIAAQGQAAYAKARTEMQQSITEASIENTNNKAYQDQQIGIWKAIAEQNLLVFQREATEATNAMILYNALAAELDEQGVKLKAEIAQIIQESSKAKELLPSIEARVGAEVAVGINRRQKLAQKTLLYVNALKQEIQAQQAKASLDEALAIRAAWIQAQASINPPTRAPTASRPAPQ